MSSFDASAGQPLDAVLQRISDGFIALDRDFRYVAVNDLAREGMGLSREEILGRCIWDLYPDTIGTQFEAELRRALGEQQTTIFEYFYPTRNHWYENRVYPAADGLSIFFVDVTERKRAEEALRESEMRFRGTFENATVGIGHMDRACHYIRVNQRFCEIVGHSHEELRQATCLQITHPDDMQLGVDQFDALMRGELQSFAVEKRYLRSDGSSVWVNMSVSLQRDAAGAPAYAIEVIQDISDRKRAEEELRVANERLDLAMRGSNLGIWDLDLAAGGEYRHGPVRFINVWERLGYDPAEFPTNASASRALGHPDDLVRMDAAVAACLAGETEEIRVENRIRHKDGTYHWFLTLGKTVRDSSGRPARLIGTIMDITERKQVEVALRESEECLAADLAVMTRLQEVSTRLVRDGEAAPLGEVVDAAIAITAADMGNIQLLDRGRGTLRIEASRGFEAPFLEFFNAVHDEHAACGTALRRGERVVIEDVVASPLFAGTPALDVMLAAGARAVQSTPLVARSGQLLGILSTHYRQPRRPPDRDLRVLDLLARQAADWIERSHADADLRQTKDAAESANRAKDEFLANVSHEIRTPFGAILGMTELVLATALTDEQRLCLVTAQSAAESLLALVGDLLDFEKIEAGKIELDPADFSLRALLGDTVLALGPRALQKGLQLIWHVPPEVPNALVGDVGRLRQVLVNLIGNAIKFTDRGEVVVGVEEASGGREPAHAHGSPEHIALRFSVRDTGIGIAPEARERIFRAFEQADTSTTRKHGGTGLGLAIVSQLVTLMDGKITLDSEPGQGSTFAFIVRLGRQPSPLAPTAATLQGPAQVQPLAAPLQVLVAEDNEFNVRHLERLLSRKGHCVRLVSNGREALELVEQAAFDVMLLDLHMPEMDGFGVIQAIRQREKTAGGHLPVIALTARSRKEDRERCLAAGMDEYLAKPVRAAELFAAIDRVVSALASSRAAEPAAAGASLLDPAVLLAACGDAAGLRELCQDLHTYAPCRLATLRDALTAGDGPRLREAAHKLCGLLCAFSTRAGSAAADLEELAERGQVAEARPLVEELQAMTAALLSQTAEVTLESLQRQARPGVS